MKNSALCSKNFEKDHFEHGTNITAQLGIKLTRKLKLETVPFIFMRLLRILQLWRLMKEFHSLVSIKGKLWKRKKDPGLVQNFTTL